MSEILPENYWPFDDAIVSKTRAGDCRIRMRCDYCRRIIIGDVSHSIPCTACGHGYMKEMKPKNWCSICGEPQYDNVNKPPTKVECDKCVDRKVDEISKIETKLKTQFSNTENYKKKRKWATSHKGEPIRDDLRMARETKGWSQEELGIHLGVTHQMISKMELGKLPYGEKAKKWIEKCNQPLSPYAEGQFGCGIATDSKPVAGGKNGIGDIEKGD